EVSEQFIEGIGTVLVVDDEHDVLQVGKDLLEAMGYRVLTAKDGKEAVKVYRKHKDDIAFVLLDMIMPDMGGSEVYDKMRAVNPDIKVLLSSGYSIDGRATRILERGCDGFIQKPYTVKELSRAAGRLLGKE
ncbi:MAG TPA: response regulator, partial [Desulfobacterales bacterium]|nr:response regulator [Desulfobacterales bacterium]